MTQRSSQAEAVRLQYSLRSAFFYRNRKVFQELARAAERLEAEEYDWSDLDAVGISPLSFKAIADKGIAPCRVFCHPDVIRECPRLIAYYRCMALLPQKGMGRIGPPVASLEKRTRRSISADAAQRVARIVNQFICSLIDEDPHFSLRDAHMAGALSFGTQLNGSWRNEIGVEGSRRVKGILLKALWDSGDVDTFLLADGGERPGLVAFEEVSGCRVRSGYRIAFGSEPDVSFRSAGGTLEVVIEVKAGTDPASAHERYGAAKKSFDKALGENKACVTIYLASCLTDGVRRAMAQDRLVRKEFDLADVFVRSESRQAFLEYLR